MTLGRWILLRRGHEHDRGLIAHELVHVRQWRELGAVRFLVRYLGDVRPGPVARARPPRCVRGDPARGRRRGSPRALRTSFRPGTARYRRLQVAGLTASPSPSASSGLFRPPPGGLSCPTRPAPTPSSDDAPDTEFWRPADRRGDARVPAPAERMGRSARAVRRPRFVTLRGDPSSGSPRLLVIALAAGLVWYRLGAGDGSESSTTRRAPTTSASTSTAPGSSSTAGSTRARRRRASVTVHVAGAVATPGVYELDAAPGSSTPSRPPAVVPPTPT